MKSMPMDWTDDARPPEIMPEAETALVVRSPENACMMIKMPATRIMREMIAFLTSLLCMVNFMIYCFYSLRGEGLHLLPNDLTSKARFFGFSSSGRH